MFGRKNKARRIVRDIGKVLDYSRRHLKSKSDETLEGIREDYQSSTFVKFVKKMPVMGEFYRFREYCIDTELEAREAVRRSGD
ncbi:hypothetical protein HOD75_01250 [archaeon]|jgi:hypothetical protein|nr:hypothetical protein [archaeon]MBT4241505.1 hypothetical protein [archaeon]MBT4417624.1 hypothetical protein [archaeon]